MATYLDILSQYSEIVKNIFDNLELYDKVNLASASSQFSHGFLCSNGVRYGNDLKNIVDNFEVDEHLTFFQHVGSYLKEFFIHGYIKRYHFQIIQRYCVNMTSLELHDVTICYMYQRRLSHVLALTDEDVQVLKSIKHLKKLTLNTLNITGNYIKQLKTLQDLSIINCNKLNWNCVAELIAALTDLHTLRIRCSAPGITKEVYQNLIKYSKKLETVEFSVLQSDAALLASLPALKHLEILEKNNYTPLLLELARKKYNQLESLKIRQIHHSIDLKNISCLKNLKILQCSFALQSKIIEKDWTPMENLEELTLLKSTITNETLLSVLRKCRMLRVLHLENCSKINIEFLTATIPLLRGLMVRNQRDFPLLFSFQGCYISINDNVKEYYKQAESDGVLTIRNLNIVP